MLTNQELQQLANAHTGGDLETVCWEAAAEIKELRRKLGDIKRIITYVQNREADAGCADTDDMIAAYMNIAEIVFP